MLPNATLMNNDEVANVYLVHLSVIKMFIEYVKFDIHTIIMITNLMINEKKIFMNIELTLYASLAFLKSGAVLKSC